MLTLCRIILTQVMHFLSSQYILLSHVVIENTKTAYRANNSNRTIIDTKRNNHNKTYKYLQLWILHQNMLTVFIQVYHPVI